MKLKTWSRRMGIDVLQSRILSCRGGKNKNTKVGTRLMNIVLKNRGIFDMKTKVGTIYVHA